MMVPAYAGPGRCHHGHRPPGGRPSGQHDLVALHGDRDRRQRTSGGTPGHLAGRRGELAAVVGAGDRADDGIPLHLVAARANDHDSPLLEPTLTGICDMIGPLPDGPCMHLDRGYDPAKTRDLLDTLGYDAESAAKGVPAPIQAGKRWPIERIHSWLNGYGKLGRCTDKNKIIVEFYLCLAAALTVIRRINRVRSRYRWPTRPTTRRLRRRSFAGRS
jgi:hypothetical protein